ncbi:HepT-like ribonuclease domain-containing protein [Paraburkholderia franconis]|uniref:HepT-like ribonuclease domain-containing protein n=1 Tax=Paraburkholderia franconis TaxID=2654983 RepID=UPI002AAF6831|nr:HepT-like ribonuclease domain-containing protein [Paraburkholderia franconis]
MKKNDLRIADYLDHMLEAITKIQRYTHGMDVDAFHANSLVQDGVRCNLQIIGEAARNVERDHAHFAAAHPDMPWELMYLMRNRISHGYYSVDVGVLWQRWCAICRV